MIVRAGALADAPAIARVHVASWQTSYRGIVPETYLAELSVEAREQMWASMLSAREERRCVFVAEDAAGQVVGFASGGARRDGDPAYAGELYAIYLLQSAQGDGAGRRLVAAVARRLAELEMRSMLVWVFRDNPARRFYERLGGVYLSEQHFELGGTTLTEVSYGWADTRALRGESD